MKKLNAFFCLLTFVLLTSCIGNNKLEQADAENAIIEFVKTNSIAGGEPWQEIFFDVNSIVLIEPIIQFYKTEASSIVHFNYQDEFSACSKNLKFNFKRNIDNKWILTSGEAITGVGSQGSSDKLQKWQNINILVQEGIKNKENKASLIANIRYLLLKKVKDADGNVYNTVKIGTQVWMVENLKTLKFNDGTSIPNITDSTAWSDLETPGCCWYNNNASNKNIYGALYNGYTVNTGKLAPKGWHVSTDAEWTILENYLIANGYNFDNTTKDNKIAKSLAATTGWYESNTLGDAGSDLTKNNTSGFSGLPGGFRYSDGTYDSLGHYGFWWCTTAGSEYYAWYRCLFWGNSSLKRYGNYKRFGYSVRCVRDY